MRTVRIFALMSMVFAGLLFAAGCEKKSNITQGEKSQLAASVDDWQYPHSQLKNLIDMLPEKERVKYDSPAGRAELVDYVIQQEVLFKAAQEEGLEKNEDVKKQIEEATRKIIIARYYNKFVKERAAPTEEEIHDYYENNEERFTNQAILKGQHIFSKDRQKLLNIKKRIENGEKMTTLAHKLSEDELTRPDGGDLGYFNPGGYIRFVGYSKQFSEAVFNLEVGVVSDPIKFEKGYSIVRINSKKPEHLRPYEDVKPDIINVLTNQRLEAVQDEVFSELKKRYEIHNYIKEELRATERTPEELWNLAQTSTNSFDRLNIYRQIYEKHPDSKYAAQALFMAGFVYSEELNDQYKADKTLRKVIAQYPETDVAKSARWMVDNLGKEMPDFDDLDELNKKISEKK